MSTTRFRMTRQLLHPATLIAVLALLIATSGTAYAIVITGKQIKDGTVTTADIRNGSLTGTDIKDSSLAGADIKNGSIGSSDLAATAKGARAIAAVGKSFSDATCVVVADSARGVSGCTRGGTGDYTVTLTSSAILAGSYPICSIGNNGGSSSSSDTCSVYKVDATHVRIRTYAHVGGNPVAASEMSPTVPVVVVIP